MKRLKIISLSVIGFSLAAAGSALIVKNNIFKIAKADGPELSVVIGNHPLSNGETYVIGDGSAKLSITETECRITLEDFVNNASELCLFNVDTYTCSCSFGIFNIDRPVTIEVKGINEFDNGDSTARYYKNSFYANSVSDEYSINIVGIRNEAEQDKTPKITFSSNSNLLYSTGFGAEGNADITISDCWFYATSAIAMRTYGIYATNSTINVDKNAMVTAISGEVTADDGDPNYYRTIGIEAKAFHLINGDVTARASNNADDGMSVGLKTTNGPVIVDNGTLEAISGTSQGGTTAGIWFNGGPLKINGGRVAAEGKSTTDVHETLHSWGVYSDTYENEVQMGSNMISFKAIGRYRMANWYLVPSYEGYVSTYEDISEDSSPFKVTSKFINIDPTIFYHSAFFGRIVYYYDQQPATYDGQEHQALTVSVIIPNTGATITYLGDGETEWSLVAPKYTNAGIYNISLKIEAPLFSPANEIVSYTISKANSVIQNAPTLVSDFTADGQAHNLVNAGIITGGTLMYSVNDGEYSATIPSVTEAGTYNIKYRVMGDKNHNDISPVSLGQVIVSNAPTPVPPTPTPSDNDGLPGWGIALIVIGSTLLACSLAILILFIFFPRYVIDEANKEIIRTILVWKKDENAYLFSSKCKALKINKANVYKTKSDAEKALRK